MPNTLRIKRRSSGAAGAPASLANAELAFNEVDNTLYYGKGTGGAGGTATTVDAIGGSGAFATIATAQTISGGKTFTGANDLGASTTATTPATADNSTKVATTAFVKAQGFLTANQSVALTGDVTGSGSSSISTTIAGGAVTLAKMASLAANSIIGNNTGSAATPIALTAAQVKSLLAIAATDVSGFDAQVRTSRLDQMAQPAAAVQLNSQRITSLASPIFSTDAATKGYVDTAAQGLDAKQSVKVATTANIATFGGLLTIDGVTLAEGDRVLVKNQTNTALNGIYIAGSGTWSRSQDADAWDELRSAFVFVEQGTTNADTGYVCTADAGGTIDSTAVAWVQFSSAGSYLAGANLTLTGNTFAVQSSPSFTGRVSVPAASSSAGLKIGTGWIALPNSGDAGVVEFDGGVLNYINSSGQRRRLFSEGWSIDGSNIGDTTPRFGLLHLASDDGWLQHCHQRRVHRQGQHQPQRRHRRGGHDARRLDEQGPGLPDQRFPRDHGRRPRRRVGRSEPLRHQFLGVAKDRRLHRQHHQRQRGERYWDGRRDQRRYGAHELRFGRYPLRVGRKHAREPLGQHVRDEESPHSDRHRLGFSCSCVGHAFQW